MLRIIVLVFTNEYADKVEKSTLLGKMADTMKKHQAEVVFCNKANFEQIWSKMRRADCNLQEILFISDDQELLERLQNRNCYTIACYHEKVNGILGGTQYAIEGLEEIEWEYLNKIYQRYCRIPWHITETKRCLVREMGIADLDELYELYDDERMTRYTEALFQDRNQEKQYIEDYIENIYKYYGFGTWLIHRKEDGKLIGRAGFNYRPGFDEIELGFVIGCPFWHNGYAYEVCSHLLELGKMVWDFEKVQALVDKENENSLRLLDKLGFYYVEEVVIEGKEYRRYLYE